MATSYELNSSGSIPSSVKFFSSLEPIHPPIQRVPGALYLGVKRPDCEAGHLPLPSVEVNKGGAIPPIPRARN
jgi:hypothetical protein